MVQVTEEQKEIMEVVKKRIRDSFEELRKFFTEENPGMERIILSLLAAKSIGDKVEMTIAVTPPGAMPILLECDTCERLEGCEDYRKYMNEEREEPGTFVLDLSQINIQ